MRTIKFRIEFSAPFLIASAVTDPGNYDMVPVLTGNLPYVPAGSFQGIVKDAIRSHCSENASSWDGYALCKGQLKGGNEAFCKPDTGSNPCPLCRIFGMPGGEVEAGYYFSGVYVESDYADQFKKIAGLPWDAFLVKRVRNSIDSELRRAAERKLFSSGLANVPVPLTGTISEEPAYRQYDSKIADFDYLLILLGLRLITEIGRSQSRGYGECRIIPEEDTDWKRKIEDHISAWKLAKYKGGTYDKDLPAAC